MAPKPRGMLGVTTIQEDTPMNTEELTVLAVETEARSKSNTKRIDHLEQQQEETSKMLNIMSGIQTEQKHIKEDVVEMKGDLKKITEKPEKRWDKVIDTVIATIVGALAGAIIGLVMGGVL